MGQYRFVTYESFDDGQIVRILLNRPDQRNAQSRGLLVDLNDAFMEAEADDNVRVVILGGAGKMFSSGHDLGSKQSIAEPGTDLQARNLFGSSSTTSASHSTGTPAGPVTVQCERPGPVRRTSRTLDIKRGKF